MPRPLDEKVLDDIKQLPDVAQAAGQINDTAAVVGKDGKIVKTGGAPTIAATYMPKPFAAVTIPQGRPPTGPDEIALDAGTADKQDFKLGDEVTVATDQPKRKFKLVGFASLGSATSFGGATVVIFDLKTAQQLFQKPNQVDFAFVAAQARRVRTRRSSARSPRSCRRPRRSAPPRRRPTSSARTSAQGLSFLTTGLLAFAFIAVLVGAFLIFNTFSITVAQRARELALLRTLGATRRQVLTSVMLEALTIGVIGSVVGILAGLGFAKAINALFKALGIDLPTTSLVLEPRTVIVCLLVGTIVTLAGALAPGDPRHARRAGRGAARGDRADARAAGAADAVARRPPVPHRRRARRRGPAGQGRRHLDQAARRRRRRGDPDPRHRDDLAALRQPRGALHRRARSSASRSSSAGSRARTRRATPAAPRSPQRR